MMSAEFFIPPFLLTWFLAMMGTLAMIQVARRTKVLDHPGSAADRKIHRKPTPLLGGVGLFVAFWIIVGLWAWQSELLDGFLLGKHLLGMFFGGLVLMIGGVLDDRCSLKPRYQIGFPIFAVLIVIMSGIGIDSITVPFLTTYDLQQWSWNALTIGGTPYHVVLIADLVTFVWMMLMIYTTKLSDTMDGLVPGISGIAALIIFFLSLTNDVAQPETAFLALMIVAVSLGFLIFNWHPAMIFLGESGSVWFGFMLGALSILAGSKIATTVLVMGIPLLDLLWVVARRLVTRKSLTQADKKHLGHRLLDIGFTQRKAVVFLYVLATLFGLGSLYLTRDQKVWAVVILVLVMAILAIWLVAQNRKTKDVRT